MIALRFEQTWVNSMEDKSKHVQTNLTYETAIGRAGKGTKMESLAMGTRVDDEKISTSKDRWTRHFQHTHAHRADRQTGK